MRKIILYSIAAVLYFGIIALAATNTRDPQFDVAPKEWDSQEYAKGEPVDAIGVFTVHHAVCEDKTRFLLTSEDGKKHCLRLVP